MEPCDPNPEHSISDANIASIGFLSDNGTYKIGDAILINVNSNQGVSIFGIGLERLQHSSILMETGSVDRHANFSHYRFTGSDQYNLAFANDIVYNYTVQAGDSADDLDYAGVYSMYWHRDDRNLADVIDYDSHDCTLPAPGTNGSLSYGADIAVDGVVPLALAVRSNVSDGTHPAGTPIAIDVMFNETVIVAGAPRIELETGSTDAYALYSSGNESGTLTFVYTAQDGHVAADLDYKGALDLNGGAMADVPGNNASLALPAPGSPDSLGGSGDIRIGIESAVVTNVTSTNSSGLYGEDAAIAIAVGFSRPVVVTGTPTLELSTVPARNASYAGGGSPSDTLVFVYAIADGDSSDRLAYAGRGALKLGAGAAIVDPSTGLAALIGLPAHGSLGASKAIAIDAVDPEAVSAAPLNGTGIYREGERIAINVTFTEPVVVAGAPLLAMETGATDRQAAYVAGNNSAALTFVYTVQDGDAAANLDYANSSALTLPGPEASIRDAAGNSANLTLPDPGADGLLGPLTPIVVDAMAPEAMHAMSLNMTGTYGIGDRIAIRINFTENVIVAGEPRLALETGETDRSATYKNGSGSAALTFVYKVRIGDISADLDYANSSALTLHGPEAYIMDAAGNSANLTLPPPGGGLLAGDEAIVVNATGAGVLYVTSDSPDGAYMANETIAIRVVFNENVTVGGAGAPLLAMEAGAIDRQAVYYGGGGSAALTFLYTVQQGDNTDDLNYANDTALTLNGSTIRNMSDADALLALPPTGSDGSLAHSKDIVVDTVAPSAKSASSLNATGTYRAGARIAVNVDFSEDVAVAGAPLLAMETGATDRQAAYVAGNNSAALTFLYIVQDGDNTGNLDYANSSALTLHASASASAASIRDAAGNPANLTLPDPGGDGLLGPLMHVTIDAVAPMVSSTAPLNGTGAYMAGERIAINVTFTEPVVVAGAPLLAMETGATDRQAAYVAGNNSAALTFVYRIRDGDAAANLDYANSSALTLPGPEAYIMDAAGNSANLTLPDPGGDGLLGPLMPVVVDTAAPSAVSAAPLNGTGAYMAGERIAINVTFTEPVVVAGAPLLAMETGATDRQAAYVAGNNSAALTFVYRIRDGDAAANLDYANSSALTLHGAGGAIRDAAGNDAVLVLPPPGTDGLLAGAGRIVVDTTGAGILHVTSDKPDGAYMAGEEIDIRVVFNEAINVGGGGVPILALETGETDRWAAYALGDNSTTLTFLYTVRQGDSAADLDYASPGALALNGSTVRDTSGNNASLILPLPGSPGSLSYARDIAVDTAAPTAESAMPLNASGTYGIGDRIAVNVTFSEPVVVGGTPLLAMETGATDRQALYVAGNNSAALTFLYAVQDGDAAANLDYANSSALTLPGPETSIRDAAGNAANLTLPDPGDEGSLAGSAISIDTGATTAVGPVHENATVVSAAFTARNTATITYSGGLGMPDGRAGAAYESVAIDGGYTARIAPENVSGLGGATHTIRFGGAGVDSGQAGTISLASELVGAAAAAADGAILRFADPTIRLAPGETVRIVEQQEGPPAPGAPPPPPVAIERDGFARAINATGAGNGARVAINVTGLAPPPGAAASAAPDGTVRFPPESVRMIAVFAEVTFPANATASSVPPGGLIELYASDDAPPAADIAAALGLAGTDSLRVRQAVEIGHNATHIAFDAPVRILLVGQAGGIAFYVNSTDYTVVPIAVQCAGDGTDAAAAQLGGSGECWIDTPGGGKAIHTYHLTLFGTAAAAAAPAPADAPEPVSVSVLRRAGGDPLEAPALYTAGQTIAIAVDFSAPVSVGGAAAGGGGAPYLLLDTGSAGAAALYASGNGTDRLEFSYAVRGGDITDRLSYAGTGALALGGGLIAGAGAGAAAAAASVDLPPPGAPGSLSGPGSPAVRIAPIGRPVLDMGVLDEASAAGGAGGAGGHVSRAAYMAAAEFNERQGRTDGALLINATAYGAGATAGSAAEALRAAHSSGAGPSVYIGPSTDRGLHAAMPYASENGIVLVSAGSTAPSLAVEGDTVFRLLPSGRLEAEALARLAYGGGDESVHMVLDNATYGPLLGGSLDDAALPPPQGGFFHAFGAALSSAAISPLSSTVTLAGGGGGGPYEAGAAAAALDASVRSASAGGSPVSVVYLGSTEGLVALAESSASHPALSSASWLASSLSAGSSLLAGEGPAARFAAGAGLVAPFWSPPESDAGRRIDSRLPGMGLDERNSAYAAYDAVLVVGAAGASAASGARSGATDAAVIADGLTEAAAEYTGALGDIALDYAGDLWVPAKYDRWTVVPPGGTGGGGAGAEWERQPGELDGERACSITLTRARIDYGPIDSGQTSRPHLQTIVNTGQLPFAQVDLSATPWHVDSPGACAPGDQPSLPVGLSEIRTELGGRFSDLVASGTALARGLEAGSMAPVWYRLSLAGYADLPQAQITQCATYVVRCS